MLIRVGHIDVLAADFSGHMVLPRFQVAKFMGDHYIKLLWTLFRGLKNSLKMAVFR